MKTGYSSVLLTVSFLVGAAMSSAFAQDAEMPYRAEPLEGIITAGQPNAAALAELAGQGVVSIIDLRGVDEDRGYDEASVVEGLGMSYIPLPIAGADSISYDNASALDRILADLDGPVLIHCSSSNRVGALLALRAKMHGADDAEALALGEGAGLTRLKPTVEQVLSTPPAQ